MLEDLDQDVVYWVSCAGYEDVTALADRLDQCVAALGVGSWDELHIDLDVHLAAAVQADCLACWRREWQLDHLSASEFIEAVREAEAALAFS